KCGTAAANANDGARTTIGEAMNEIMVGELSEFAEGGYRVLRVDAFEFGIFREGDRLVAYENHCPHDGGPVCQGKAIPRVEGGPAPPGGGPGFPKDAQIRRPRAGRGFGHGTRPPLRRPEISPAAGRREGARQPRLRQRPAGSLRSPHAEELRSAGGHIRPSRT